MSIREPAVAGRFYTGNPEELTEEVNGFLGMYPLQAAAGCIVPHAGYMYSGATAGKVLGQIAVPERIVLLSPNHTGMGTPISLWPDGEWVTPLGPIAIDTDLAARILQLNGIEADYQAHTMEHSIEVILPFLQICNPNARIVPITIRTHDKDVLTAVGNGLAELEEQDADAMLIIASSDMTHMEPADSAREKDMACISHMENIDPHGLLETVLSRNISMCGAAPVSVLLAAMKAMGIQRGRLIEYTNSGEVSGDFERVVGYAGMIFDPEDRK